MLALSPEMTESPEIAPDRITSNERPPFKEEAARSPIRLFAFIRKPLAPEAGSPPLP
jgi:hypothetical protein